MFHVGRFYLFERKLVLREGNMTDNGKNSWAPDI